MQKTYIFTRLYRQGQRGHMKYTSHWGDKNRYLQMVKHSEFWRDFVNTVMTLGVLIQATNFLTD